MGKIMKATWVIALEALIDLTALEPGWLICIDFIQGTDILYWSLDLVITLESSTLEDTSLDDMYVFRWGLAQCDSVIT